jgi:hypothetical protein
MQRIDRQASARVSALAAWAREWLNVSASAPTDTLSDFESCVGALEGFGRESGARATSPRPRHVLVVVTTHARERAVLRLLRALEAQLGRLDPQALRSSLCVLEDASAADYRRAHAALAARAASVLWLRSRTHLGKQGFWRVWQAALSLALRAQADYLLVIQDDLELGDDALHTALSLMRALEARGEGRVSAATPADTSAVWPQVLSLFSSRDDERFGRWVLFPRRQLRELPVRRTQWFDLPAVLMNRRVLETLGYRVFPIAPERWQGKPQLSSGVGRQLTRRLYARAAIFQCAPSLVFHGAEPSSMNPEARGARQMDNRDEREVHSDSLRDAK